MNAHALEALEFGRIRALVARRCASDVGRERAERIAPLAEQATIDLVLDGVAEAHALQISEPDWDEIACPDVREALRRCMVEGAVLDAADLVQIGRFLEIAARIPRFFTPRGGARRHPVLGALADRLLVDPAFARRITRSFEPSGEVRDEASTALRRVRRDLRRLRQSVSARLEELSQRFRTPGEESHVTLRGGRYVLSLAAAEKRQLPGIVHDRSSTGKTLFVEPLDLIDANNDLAEMEAQERAEIHRILRELSDWVRERHAALRETAEALGELDEYAARARLARDLQATRPSLEEASRTLHIVRGRHPLLFLAIGDRTVPLDLTLEGARRGMVISGPNMGGKSVVLKTVGLLTVMAQSGLFVPAGEGTTLPWCDEIFVDIGDEQSLDSDLSTYAARLRNMRAALTAASRRSLVLLDELGAGTDPAEGAALGQALLAEIGRREAFCVATTHLGAFKAFAAKQTGFENAAMEYDPQTLGPTYRLLTGVPGRSHAFELAEREGWPQEQLEAARVFLPAPDAQADELLARIEEELRELREARAEVASKEQRLTADRESYRRLSGNLKRRMSELRIERAMEEDRRIREARGLLAELRARWTRAEAQRPVADPAEERQWFHERERALAEMERTRPPVPRRESPPATEPLAADQVQPGREVFARSLGVPVKILERAAGGKRVWVDHRGVRVVVPAGDLVRLPERSEQEPPAAPAQNRPAARTAHASPGTGAGALQEELSDSVRGEIDLRGLSREECLAQLDLYLDRALLAGYPQVRIIHGKGTGTLQREVQAYLKKHRHVRAQRGGEAHEGGWGVTIAMLGESEGRDRG
ncbi:MAG: hypothetical protein GF330_01730 [Candidatus Eisenbacteria bacterium]|nr:hypothetical protein [Candidatus Eisenbacteria bacterium]